MELLMAIFDVNNSEVIALSARLEELNRSAFPSAVRNTLNDATFDMKKRSVIESARKNFKSVKEPKLLKKSLLIDKATGFNINSMKSKIGITQLNNNLKPYAEGLEKQEKGGVIDDGSRYLKGARGGRINGKVRLENYYDKNKVISGRSNTARGKGTRKSKFVARAFMSNKLNKPFFGNSMKGNMLFKVTKISSSKGKIKMKIVPVMMSRSKTPSKIKATGFMREAANDTASKMDGFFKKQAEFQIKKALK